MEEGDKIYLVNAVRWVNTYHISTTQAAGWKHQAKRSCTLGQVGDLLNIVRQLHHLFLSDPENKCQTTENHQRLESPCQRRADIIDIDTMKGKSGEIVKLRGQWSVQEFLVKCKLPRIC